MSNYILREEVLDHGFVELIDVMPRDIPEGAESRDIAIVNAARVSYLGESKGTESDKKLLKYLYKNKHTSVFEQVEFKFRIKAPVLVWWQQVRHRTWSYNLQSGRYTEYPEEFYIPKEWRLQDNKNKQGSLQEFITEITYDNGESYNIAKLLEEKSQIDFFAYKQLVELGVAREQARLFLPAFALYHIGYAKVDAKNLLDFLRLRTHEHAQYEIRQYALAMERIFKEILPWTWGSFNETK